MRRRSGSAGSQVTTGNRFHMWVVNAMLSYKVIFAVHSCFMSLLPLTGLVFQRTHPSSIHDCDLLLDSRKTILWSSRYVLSSGSVRIQSRKSNGRPWLLTSRALAAICSPRTPTLPARRTHPPGRHLQTAIQSTVDPDHACDRYQPSGHCSSSSGHHLLVEERWWKVLNLLDVSSVERLQWLVWRFYDFVLFASEHLPRLILGLSMVALASGSMYLENAAAACW